MASAKANGPTDVGRLGRFGRQTIALATVLMRAGEHAVDLRLIPAAASDAALLDRFGQAFQHAETFVPTDAGVGHALAVG